jgi:predicted lipoprotein with Yx(FWY)xxD motif
VPTPTKTHRVVPAPAPTAGVTTVVQLGTINGKRVLVDQNGKALYLFTGDTTDVSTCNAGCTPTWQPLIGPANAGTGVQQADLSMSTRQDGRQQVTYLGHPLYRFGGDQQPGQANGEGIGGTWFLVDQQGQPVK